MVVKARASSRGYIAVDREIFDDPLFAPESFSETHAFLWMVAEAAWAPRHVRSGRAIVQLQRGQLAYATRFLAQKFKWTDSRVRRFLLRLSTAHAGIDAKINTLGSRETTIITIANYDDFQLSRRAPEPFRGSQLLNRCRARDAKRNLVT